MVPGLFSAVCTIISVIKVTQTSLMPTLRNTKSKSKQFCFKNCSAEVEVVTKLNRMSQYIGKNILLQWSAKTGSVRYGLPLRKLNTFKPLSIFSRYSMYRKSDLFIFQTVSHNGVRGVAARQRADSVTSLEPESAWMMKINLLQTRENARRSSQN